jgi:hypothetical protein
VKEILLVAVPSVAVAGKVPEGVRPEFDREAFWKWRAWKVGDKVITAIALSSVLLGVQAS